MLKKRIWTVFLLSMLMILVALPVFAGGGKDVLKGKEIKIGHWWDGYDINTYKPTTETAELTLEWRKKVSKDYGVVIKEITVATWSDMMETAVTTIMAGKPAANVFIMQPDWAMALYNMGLLYPVSDSKAVNLKTSTAIVGKQVAYNQDVAQLFTFSGKQYGIGIGYGQDQHGVGIYFNKRLFREAGLDPNLPYDLQKAGTWTWDRFFDVCKRLTRDRNNDGRIDTYAMPADNSDQIIDQVVFSNGAEYVAREASGRFVNASNRPAFLEALNFTKRLYNEGVMMHRPENADWDWYWPMFHDGHVAMMMEPEWRRGELADMTDDWGFVLFPKGPRARDYRYPNDEVIYCIPATYTPAEADGILIALNLWYTPASDDWKTPLYSEFRDRRAVDETMAMIRDPKYYAFRYNILIPGLERGNINWELYYHDGDPSQLVEAVSQNWNALIKNVNDMR
jgi:ABC-type glycerol-3-phosphate transport system substrate-binding protein